MDKSSIQIQYCRGNADAAVAGRSKSDSRREYIFTLRAAAAPVATGQNSSIHRTASENYSSTRIATGFILTVIDG